MQSGGGGGANNRCHSAMGATTALAGGPAADDDDEEENGCAVADGSSLRPLTINALSGISLTGGMARSSAHNSRQHSPQ